MQPSVDLGSPDSAPAAAVTAAALELLSGWPDPSTADVTLQLRERACSPESPCSSTRLAIQLRDRDGVALPASPRLVWSGPGRVGPESLRLRLCRHDANPVTVCGRFTATETAELSLASALRVTPVLIRRALSADPAQLAGVPVIPGTRPIPVNAAAGGLRKAARRWTRTREWRVGTTQVDSAAELRHGVFAAPITWVRPRSWRRFWADPCPVVDASGQLWIFVEEYDRLEGRGSIVALLVINKQVRARRVVLSDEHHRALPRVKRIGDRWIATTDTCQTPSAVYTFREPGDAWAAVADAFLPGFLSDPELVQTDSGWTVVGTNWLEDENAVNETWTAPTGPPFDWFRDDSEGFADPAVARNGGSMDAHLGLRVTQDCSGEYGMNIVLTRYPRPPQQSPLAGAIGVPEFAGRPGRAGGGAHTLGWTHDHSCVAVDIWWERFDPLARLWMMRDQRHLIECRQRTKTRIAAVG